MPRSELVLLFLVALAACKGSTTPDERPLAILDAAPKTTLLGDPCESGPACGTKQRVSMEENLLSTALRTRPTCKRGDLDALAEEAAATQLAMLNGEAREWACVNDGKLWAYRECTECRHIGGGWSAIVQLDELTRAQSLALQTRLRLPADQPLAGEAAWNQALVAREAARPKLPPRKPQGDASTSRLDDDAGTTRGTGKR